MRKLHVRLQMSITLKIDCFEIVWTMDRIKSVNQYFGDNYIDKEKTEVFEITRWKRDYESREEQRECCSWVMCDRNCGHKSSACVRGYRGTESSDVFGPLMLRIFVFIGE